jgi:hypothetical protein
MLAPFGCCRSAVNVPSFESLGGEDDPRLAADFCLAALTRGFLLALVERLLLLFVRVVFAMECSVF